MSLRSPVSQLLRVIVHLRTVSPPVADSRSFFCGTESGCESFRSDTVCGYSPPGLPDIFPCIRVYLSMSQSFSLTPIPPSNQSPVRIPDIPVHRGACIYPVLIEDHVIGHDIEYFHCSIDIRLSTHSLILFIPFAFPVFHGTPHIKSNSVGVSISFSASCRYPTPSRK